MPSALNVAKTRALLMLPIAVAALIASWPGSAAQPTLVIGSDGKSREFTAAELLSRKDAASLTVPDDVSYRRPMTYRVVPLLALLDGVQADRFDTVEARATDGFVGQIPLALISRGAHGGAIAWLAVEDPAHPWPPLPRRKSSAGPFYLVWEHSRRSNVSSEQWPYALASLRLAQSPVRRWPQLALPADRSTDTAARSGQKVFFGLCLPCHQLNGGGVGKVGPDLGRPMSATRYMTEAGLRALIRDPRAVRTWPDQHMSGFGRETLPDADLDALLAYLRAMGEK